jgi:uncharacterized protein (DUF362 family)
MNRREFIPLAAAGLLSGTAGFIGGRRAVPEREARSTVHLANATAYTEDLVTPIFESLRASEVAIESKKILLKPNLGGFSSGESASTHPAVVAAAISAFQRLGAAEILIGDAPAAHRDTWALAEAAGYRKHIRDFDRFFVDLNGDDVAPIQGFGNGKPLYLPVTALRADLVVSIAKLRKDQERVADLSMTNLFGLFPGSVYGWSGAGPVGKLAHGMGSAKAAVDLVRAFRRGFAIVDGVMAEGVAGVLAMGRDLVAVDATCCRRMGIDPAQVEYLQLAADREGVVAEDRIQVVRLG